MLLLVLAGCGGGSEGGGGGEVTPSTLASKAGCESSFKTDTTTELYARELGKCTIDGAEVSLYSFASNENRDNWLKVASGFGGLYLVLDKGVLTADSKGALETAKASAGGTLK